MVRRLQRFENPGSVRACKPRGEQKICQKPIAETVPGNVVRCVMDMTRWRILAVVIPEQLFVVLHPQFRQGVRGLRCGCKYFVQPYLALPRTTGERVPTL